MHTHKRVRINAPLHILIFVVVVVSCNKCAHVKQNVLNLECIWRAYARGANQSNCKPSRRRLPACCLHTYSSSIYNNEHVGADMAART